MEGNRYKLIYLVTFLSGAAGLIYEISWTRMLVVIFGNSAHSSVAVISAFLGGIAIGSIIVGYWSDLREPETLKKAYIIFELGIAISAITSIFILPFAYKLYSLFSDGSGVTIGLLLLRFGISLAILIIPTLLMGGTIPILVALLKSRLERIDNSLSMLYSLNTLGAVFGVLFAAFVAIELFGIRESIYIGAILNSIAAALMFTIPIKYLKTNFGTKNVENRISLTTSEKIILFCFFMTGLITIAYEVLWSRVLAPSMGTFIYAFASVLAIYLFGIFLGAFIYNKFLQHLKTRSTLFSFSQAGIGLFALLSALIVSNVSQNELLLMLITIFITSFFMGISFPSGSFLMRRLLHVGKLSGVLYFLNTIGCILGGILAVFVFIPLVGSVGSIIIFSSASLILSLTLLVMNTKIVKTKIGILMCVILLIALTFSAYALTFQKKELIEIKTKLSMKEVQNDAEVIYKEDSLTSVLGLKLGDNAEVFVNGVGMTGLVLETRLMAHIPIALHPNPKSFLAICFGMGSTYRSARLHGLNVDAVELSPSVASLFPIFYPETDEKLPGKGRIIVNDGRNYVNLTRKKYDIITVDPPPPLNAAGTTVLYSEEFYTSMKRILNPGGIVMEWMIPGDRPEDILMTQKSFLNSFPYVYAIKWNGDTGGFFMFGSLTPININSERINKIMFSSLVRDDVLKFHRLVNADEIVRLIVNREELVKKTKNVRSITDNHPITEYFALRYLFNK